MNKYNVMFTISNVKNKKKVIIYNNLSNSIILELFYHKKQYILLLTKDNKQEVVCRYDHYHGVKKLIINNIVSICKEYKLNKKS